MDGQNVINDNDRYAALYVGPGGNVFMEVNLDIMQIRWVNTGNEVATISLTSSFYNKTLYIFISMYTHRQSVEIV